MNLVNLITLASFLGAIVLGVMFITLQDLRSHRPEARIRARMGDVFTMQTLVVPTKDNTSVDDDLFNVTREGNAFSRWFRPKLDRLRTVSGKTGIRVVVGVAIMAEIIALLMARFMPLPTFLLPILIVGLPVMGAIKAYGFLVERFRKRFLNGFPDLIDLLVRAVRSGVPVTHVIGTAADEIEEPLRHEFKLMSDSLQIGIDLEAVLAAAMKRIEVADFSFFCVCLLLQRETGGQLGETLENLATIVRTRREISQKAKALTGEARITTKILSAVPVVVMGAMYLTNKTYIDVLFDTSGGQKLMTFASISVAIGIIIITKMSKLDTSR